MLLPFLNVFRRVRLVESGSQNYTSPGTYNFVVPDYDTFTADVRGGSGGGGGGGAGAGIGTNGGAGTFSRIIAGLSQLLANAGLGGRGGGNGSTGAAGAHGTASGGDTNTTGGGPAGGNGGVYTYAGGKGGNGGRSVKTWAAGDPGAPIPGSTIQVVVGTRGTPGANVNGLGTAPGYGNYGAVYFSWS